MLGRCNTRIEQSLCSYCPSNVVGSQFILLTQSSQAPTMSAQTSISLQDLRFGHHPTGLGLSTPSPRLSWRFNGHVGDGQASTNQGWYQSAYEIEIKRPSRTERVCNYNFQSNSNNFVPWPDAPLQSRERVSVRVRAFGATASDGHAPEPTEWTSWSKSRHSFRLAEEGYCDYLL